MLPSALIARTPFEDKHDSLHATLCTNAPIDDSDRIASKPHVGYIRDSRRASGRKGSYAFTQFAGPLAEGVSRQPAFSILDSMNHPPSQGENYLPLPFHRDDLPESPNAPTTGARTPNNADVQPGLQHSRPGRPAGPPDQQTRFGARATNQRRALHLH